MVGFQNANFWGRSFANSPDWHRLPHKELLLRVDELSNQYADCPTVQAWCREHEMSTEIQDKQQRKISNEDVCGNTADDEEEYYYFEPRAVHELCATVLRQGQQRAETQSGTSSNTGDDMNHDYQSLKEFTELLVESEIRIILAHALRNAGFSPSEKGQEFSPTHQR